MRHTERREMCGSHNNKWAQSTQECTAHNEKRIICLNWIHLMMLSFSIRCVSFSLAVSLNKHRKEGGQWTRTHIAGARASKFVPDFWLETNIVRKWAMERENKGPQQKEYEKKNTERRPRGTRRCICFFFRESNEADTERCFFISLCHRRVGPVLRWWPDTND